MGSIKNVHVEDLDLNLLRALAAIAETASITRAAAKLGITQPAMSHMLERLRAALGDPLFVRTRDGMKPTERARDLLAPITQGLSQIDHALRRSTSFDAARARRSFSLTTDDYAQALLLPPLFARLATEAPGIDLAVLPPREAEAAPAALDAGKIDFIVAGRSIEGQGVVKKLLWNDGFTCAVRADHPAAKRGLDLEAYANAAHVVIAPGGRPGSFVDALLAERGLTRRTALRVPSFLVAPLVIAENDLVLTVGRRLAARLAATHGLVLVDPPLPMPSFAVTLYWHARNQDDAAHRWMRQRLVDAAKAESS